MLAVELVGFYWRGGEKKKVKLCFVGKCASVVAEHSVPSAAARHPSGARSCAGAVVGALGWSRDGGPPARQAACEPG